MCKSIIEDNRTTFYKLEDIKVMKMGASLMIAPYDFGWYMQNPDATVLPIFAKSKKISKYLPNLGFDDEQSTKDHLKSYLLKAEAQLGITYVIRQNNFPIGMVFVNTPLYNKKAIGLAIWTIDFFIAEMFEHQGLVFQSLIRVLSQMKTAMSAHNVYALVDKSNSDCINVIGKGLFDTIDNTHFINKDNNGDRPLVYCIDLSTIRFERR